jgi:hypothetical protein
MASAMTTTVSYQKQNLETYSLVWLQSVTFIQPDVEQQLRSLINRIDKFNEIEECESYIRRSKDERIMLIANEEFARNIVPRIHNLVQLSSIYIYGVDEKDDNWTNGYHKVIIPIY